MSYMHDYITLHYMMILNGELSTAWSPKMWARLGAIMNSAHMYAL